MLDTQPADPAKTSAFRHLAYGAMEVTITSASRAGSTAAFAKLGLGVLLGMIATETSRLTWFGTIRNAAYLHTTMGSTIASQLRAFLTIRSAAQGSTPVAPASPAALGDVEAAPGRALLDPAMGRAIVGRGTRGLVTVMLST